MKLEVLRDGHLIAEYHDPEALKIIIALSNNPSEIIAALLTAIEYHRSGVKTGSFKIGSVRVRFMKGEGR